MCGIIGYVGDEDALSVLYEGLQNLEYRGYDSAGVALLNGDALDVFKRKGEVDMLGADLPDASDATCGMGHTRWSTHGEPADRNAHPHADCTGNVAVVHNGIIENFDALKSELSSNGHRFVSETDTEVISHLVEDELDGTRDLSGAVRNAVNRLEGSYAICVMAADEERVVVTRVGSPLVIGFAGNGHFVASDVTAFLEHTREVVFLENGDVAELTRDGVSVSTIEGEPVERTPETVDWDAEAAQKGGYEHYMLKEIHEQPRALRRTLSGRIDEVKQRPELDLSLPEAYLRSLEEVQFVAMGTSFHAGLYARLLVESYAGVRASVEQASEYEFRGGRDPWRTLVVAVTQSGETSDTLGAVREANRSGARTLAVTNTLGSTVTREADEVLYIKAGPEIGVAATKTFASQAVTLALFAAHLGRMRDTGSTRETSDLLESLRSTPGAVQQILDLDGRVRDVAEQYAGARAFFFLGRFLGYPVALEGSLKLKEISYAHAEGFSSGELKHGPLALVTPETVVLALLTRGTKPEETIHNVKEVESRGAPVVGISSAGFEEAGKFVDENLEVPDLGVMETIPANVYFQLFAYHVARIKGRSIDKPRNLAKSVTVK